MRSDRVFICGSAALLLAYAAFLAVSATAEAEAPSPTPQTREGGPIVRITAATINLADAHDSVRIDLVGWSTDAELSVLPKVWNAALARVAALAAAKTRGETTNTQADAAPAGNGVNKGVVAPPRPAPKQPPTPRAALYDALQKGPTHGYVWSGAEVSGYAIKYAVQEPDAGGGKRIVLITDRRLGGHDDRWDFTGPSAATFNKAALTAGPYAFMGSDINVNEYDEFSVIEIHINSSGQGAGKISAGYTVAVDPSTNTIVLPNYNELPVVLTNVRRHDYESEDKRS